MSVLLARSRNAERPPTPDERLEDLLELHAARPGVTEATLGSFTTAEGMTSVQVGCSRS
jgi:hypothetical protein